MDEHTREHLHETPWVVWLPLVVLAVPSVIAGGLLIEPLLYSAQDWLRDSIFVLPRHNVLLPLKEEFRGAWAMALHAVVSPACWLAALGIVVAWLSYIRYPQIPGILATRFSRTYTLLQNKYGFDAFNERVFVQGSRGLGESLFQIGDVRVIDGQMVLGSSRLIAWSAKIMRHLQSGYLYHYALMMVIALLSLLVWLICF
jgi:NADH-quinone oxidoreductase subunit L